MTVVIVVDRFVKYMSVHNYFSANSYLGYATISQNTFSSLPEEVRVTLQEIKPEPFIQITFPGLA